VTAVTRTIEEIRAEAQDDETRGLIRLTVRRCLPLLSGGGWQVVFPGEDGLGCWDKKRGRYQLRLIHSIARELDGDVWAHLSVSRRDGVLPTWDQARDVWRLLYPDITGVVVIPPETDHVNLGEVAHIWGDLTRPAVPDFTHGLKTI
jgi:hypothetical protein